MGYHNLLYGNLITLNIDDKDRSYKLLSKKSVSKKLSFKQFGEDEYDNRCLFRIIP